MPTKIKTNVNHKKLYTDVDNSWVEMNVLLKEMSDLRLCISAQNMRIQKLEDCIYTLFNNEACVCVNLSKTKKSPDESIHHNLEYKIEPKESASEPYVPNQYPSSTIIQEEAKLYPPYLSKNDNVVQPIHLQHRHGGVKHNQSTFCVKTYVFHEYDADPPLWPEREEKGIQFGTETLNEKSDIWRKHLNLKLSTYVNTDVYPVKLVAVDNSTQYYTVKMNESSIDVSIQSNSFVDDYCLVEDSDYDK